MKVIKVKYINNVPNIIEGAEENWCDIESHFEGILDVKYIQGWGKYKFQFETLSKEGKYVIFFSDQKPKSWGVKL
jgi:hypothetical protein